MLIKNNLNICKKNILRYFKIRELKQFNFFNFIKNIDSFYRKFPQPTKSDGLLRNNEKGAETQMNRFVYLLSNLKFRHRYG